MKKMIILIVFIILCIIILSIIPLKYTININEINSGYILKIQQTTGPVWVVKEIKGENILKLVVGEQVILIGSDPYLKLSKNIVTSPENLYYFNLSFVKNSYDSELEKEFKVLNIIDWNICHPILRENTFLRYNKSFFNIFDYFR